LPIIILGLFSLISYAPSLFGTPDPNFTWKPQGVYRQQRTTPTYKVNFYINPSEWNSHPFITEANAAPLESKATSKLKGFEKRVENSFKNALYNECERHRQYQERRIQATYGTLGWGAKPDLEKKIREEVYESCERLKDFGIRYGPLI
jgi:DnaJ family protein B protein 12